MGKIDKNNYFKSSYVVFNYRNTLPKELKDRESDFISDSGSEYWYTDDGVFRLSDHWGKVGNCVWDFKISLSEYSNYDEQYGYESKIGFAFWEDFKEIEWIEVDDIQCNYNDDEIIETKNTRQYHLWQSDYFKGELYHNVLLNTGVKVHKTNKNKIYHEHKWHRINHYCELFRFKK